MNDIQLITWKKAACLGSKKASTGQNFYSNEYYAEQPLPPLPKSSRLGLRSMSRTELSEERAKSKTNRINNHGHKSPNQDQVPLESTIQLQNVKSQPRLASRLHEPSKLSLLQKEGRTREAPRQNSRRDQPHYFQNANNKVESRLKGKTKSKITLHLQHKAMDSYLQELRDKQMPQIRGRKGSEELPFSSQLSSGSKLAKSESPQQQSNDVNLSRILEYGPNYLRVSNYSIGDNLGEISCIKEQGSQSSSQQQSPPKISHDDSVSLINYLSKFSDEETTDREDDQEDLHSLIHLLSCSIIPQRRAPVTILDRLENIEELVSHRYQNSIKRVDAHAEIIALYEQMSELSELFCNSPNWLLLRALLYSKYYAERSRIEMALRGHANCFTIEGVNLSNQQLNDMQKIPQLGSIIGRVNRQNGVVLKRLQLLTEPFRGSKAEFNEHTFTNTLLVSELRKQYVRLCQEGTHVNNFERLAWIMSIVLLTEQLRSPSSRCFSSCLQSPCPERFLLKNYPTFNQVLQQF